MDCRIAGNFTQKKKKSINSLHVHKMPTIETQNSFSNPRKNNNIQAKCKPLSAKTTTRRSLIRKFALLCSDSGQQYEVTPQKLLP